MRSASRRRKRSRPPEERSKSCNEQAVPGNSEYFQHAGSAQSCAVYAGACWRCIAWAGTFRRRESIRTLLQDSCSSRGQGSVLGLIDLFSGGNLRRLTIFALGIMPYITASIILQLMVVVWPYLERLQKEGELGRRKITQYTRYLTIILSVFQSFTIADDAAAQSMNGRSAGLSPRRAIYSDDHADADHRVGVHHVAGRADQRARDRQWDVADYFRGHRRGFAERGARSVSEGHDAAVGTAHGPLRSWA